MMKSSGFDVAVVGGGPAGYVAAIRASQLGMRTALVEKAEMGGICLNWGCIPTKALLRSADVLRLVRMAGKFGVVAEPPSIDLAAMVARSRAVASQLQRGVNHLMKKNGITVFNAHARLAGHGRMELDAMEDMPVLAARHIVLATGARARIVPGLEPDTQNVWYYREALTPTAVPKRLLVIGAGAIGIEFASFYHALGAQVHVLDIANSILPGEDDEISQHMQTSLTGQGITLHVGCRIASMQRSGAGWEVALTGENVSPFTVDVILVAAGIVGNVEGLGLENTAVNVENTHIVTDEYGATAEPGVYAVGDVAGAPWLAHKASHEAVVCIENMAGLDPHPVDINRVPACTYSHPQVARVGLTERQAHATGRPLRIGRFPFAANGKAIALGDTDGFVKVIMDEQSGELLGAHMVGHEVTEMIHGYAIASQLETTELDLIRTIFPHPTQSEAMHEAVLAAYGLAVHI